MNRTLLYFSLILIIAGLILGIYLIAFVGFLLLLPSLLTTSRPPAKPSPAPAKPSTAPTREAPRHIAPPPVNKPEAVPPPGQPTPMPAATVPPAAMGQSYSLPIFPTPLMPSLSTMGMGSVSQMEKEVMSAKHEGRDDLIEVVAILAVLKLISS